MIALRQIGRCLVAGVVVLVSMAAYLAGVCLLCEWIYVLVGAIVR